MQLLQTFVCERDRCRQLKVIRPGTEVMLSKVMLSCSADYCTWPKVAWHGMACSSQLIDKSKCHQA